MSLRGWPEAMLAAVAPAALPAPQLVAYSGDVATLLGWPQDRPNHEQQAILAGNASFNGQPALATAYAGHQFGVWAGQLGDGRALCIGEQSGQEIQLKGAGPTPFSRGADGRAVLRSSIREFLASEAMHALGIPTTRALAIVGSPLTVRRETMETAAVVTRVAPSFARFGHFEWLAATDQAALMPALADQLIAAHFPELAQAPDRHRRWLTEVVRRTAELMAQWQAAGFCHGVMNTDNFSLLGLTLDYGPYGFLDAFDAHHICNHSDEGGRYAYDQQPQVGHWNCAQLLSACLPLLAEDRSAAVEQATTILDGYPEIYAAAAQRRWRAKLGLLSTEADDADLINRWLTLLHRTRADFNLSFHGLAALDSHSDAPGSGRDHNIDPLAYDAWIERYRARLRREDSDNDARQQRMQAVNPRYVLRNHLAQAAIERAQAGDFSEVERLHRLLRKPFTEQAGMEAYAEAPAADHSTVEVSCSS